MKTFDVTTLFGTEPNCSLSASRYADNDHIALQVWCEDGPFADLTVNLPETIRYPKNFGYVNTNNFPQAVELIRNLGIGEWTGGLYSSEYCTYPLYEFNLDAIRRYTDAEPDGSEETELWCWARIIIKGTRPQIKGFLEGSTDRSEQEFMDALHEGRIRLEGDACVSSPLIDLYNEQYGTSYESADWNCYLIRDTVLTEKGE